MQLLRCALMATPSTFQSEISPIIPLFFIFEYDKQTNNQFFNKVLFSKTKKRTKKRTKCCRDWIDDFVWKASISLAVIVSQLSPLISSKCRVQNCNFYYWIQPFDAESFLQQSSCFNSPHSIKVSLGKCEIHLTRSPWFQSFFNSIFSRYKTHWIILKFTFQIFIDGTNSFFQSSSCWKISDFIVIRLELASDAVDLLQRCH